MIPKSILSKLQNNPCLEYEYYNQIGIKNCKLTHEVFEKVFTFIANDNDMNWKDIYHSTPKDERKFTLLCICSILIDKFLRNEFHMKIQERSILLGYYRNELVRYYYRFN
jgi:hypothetical protein